MDPEIRSFEEALRRLRVQFVAGCAERFDRIEDFLSEMEAGPSNSRALHDLMVQFHGFTGSGSTYGFPRVTILGSEGERFCDELLKAGRAMDKGDLARCRSLAESLRSEIGQTLAAEPAAPSRSEAMPSSFDILVVDCESSLRVSVERLALAEGMSVRGAATVGEALEKLGQRLPEGVIVEARLPDGSGYELAERIRSLPGGESLAILMIGEASGFPNRVDAIHGGADGY